MTLWRSVLIAVRSLGGNKLRTFLTTLGIIIGVAAVIALLAVGLGSQASVTEQFQRLGSNVLTIFPGGRTGLGIGPPLTYEDALALREIAGIAAVSPERSGQLTLTAGATKTSGRVIGVVPDYATVHSARVATGSFIGEQDVQSGAAVAVLGSRIATNLFGAEPALGATVRIGGVPFRVVGVMASVGGGGFGSDDDSVFVPLTSANRRFFGTRAAGVTGQPVGIIAVQATRPEAIPGAMARMRALLRERRRLAGEDDFTIFNQQETLNSLTEATRTLTIFLGAIAGISLLVGGIGIMNIMLVTVTERTREIGLRKAVGATRSDLLRQFLIEAVVVSAGGGLLGLLGGLGTARGVAAAGVARTIVAPWTLALSFGCALAIGVAFGLYPASRAARLHPIDALRRE